MSKLHVDGLVPDRNKEGRRLETKRLSSQRTFVLSTTLSGYGTYTLNKAIKYLRFCSMGGTVKIQFGDASGSTSGSENSDFIYAFYGNADFHVRTDKVVITNHVSHNNAITLLYVLADAGT